MQNKKEQGLLSLLVLCLSLSLTGYGQAQDRLVILFDFSESKLSETGKAAIDSFLSLHGGRPGAIELYGHCDSIGGDLYNDRLSRSRVWAVRDYLHSKIPAASPFQNMKGYGRRRPLNDNGDEEKRSLNRRVEIIFHPAAPPPALAVPGPPVAPPAPPAKPAADSPRSNEPSPVTNQPAAASITLTEALRDTASLLGRNIVLRHITFYGDRHFPLPESYYELDNLLSFLKARPGVSIEIQGYVCCMPDRMDGYDANTRTADLSLQRAKFVYTYLLQQGIPASRMSYKGFGASHKLYPEENNERERELNRRVEIKVLSW